MNRNQQQNYEAGRRAQIASRNASSFDIIGFNPDSQVNSKDQERYEKKQKQAAYRDQLNSMVTNKSDQRGQRTPVEDYSSNQYREPEYERERRVEPAYSEVDQRRFEEESNSQDKKKRMQQEINNANRLAAQTKAMEKKQQKAYERANDSQRTQDSLSQFEMEGFRQKEAKRLMNEENTRVLEQQVKDSSYRKQGPSTPSYDSVDQLHYDQYERNVSNPLAPSYSKMNQQPQSIDHLSQQMNKLSASCPFAREDDDIPRQKQSQYDAYQQGNQNRYQEPQRPNIDNGSQYQKNKNRNQGGYNIINHQG